MRASMFDHAVESEAGKQPQGKPAAKNYQKPSFRYERVFETMALSCGKISPTEFLCHHNQKNS